MISGKFKENNEVDLFIEGLIKRILIGPFESGSMEEFFPFLISQLNNSDPSEVEKYALLKFRTISKEVEAFCQKLKEIEKGGAL
jgi:hypothetical protein